jgi:ribonuclease P protein component
MLPRNNRLSAKNDFENVYQNGKSVSTPLFKILVLKNNEEDPRFGIVVSKKVSTKANERNKVKRIIREFVRGNLRNIAKGCDYVIVVKASILHADHATIESELLKAFK